MKMIGLNIFRYDSLSKLVMAVTLMISVFSCNKENAPDCVQAAGDFTTVKRPLENFSEVELRDYIQVELYDSTEYFVEITAPKNLIPEIETEVKSGRLKVENKNTCNFMRSFKKRIIVRIYAPDFGNIQNFGTGDIRSINTIVGSSFKLANRNAAGVIDLEVQADSVTIATHTGVCDVSIKGASTLTTLFNQGVGIVDARNLITTDAYVNNSSINKVYVNTHGYLYTRIEFSGNVYYSGAPNHIDMDVNGDGRLIPLIPM